jgi:hypothetical protein
LGRILRGSLNEAFGSGDMVRAEGLAERLLKVFPDDANLASQLN